MTTTAARIKTWLNGDRLDVHEAMTIYSKIGGPYPYQYFSPYIDAPFLPDSVEKLIVEIFEDFLEKNPVNCDEIVFENDSKVIVSNQQEPARGVNTDHLLLPVEPEEIRQLRDKGKRYMKQQSFLHAHLSDDMHASERYKIAKELVEEVVPEIDKIYNTIRQYERTGEVPVAAATMSLKAKVIALINKQKSLESRISRIKGKLTQKLTPEDKLKYEKELLEKQHALLEIEKELN